jgi:hypothetical protein
MYAVRCTLYAPIGETPLVGDNEYIALVHHLAGCPEGLM